MVEVIPYTTEFRGKVYDLIKQFYEESINEYGFLLEYEDFEHYEKTNTIFVMLEDCELIGVISGQIIKQPMSDKRIYQESIWYVDRDHRKHGLKLLKYLEEWCVENGIGQVIMAFMHNSMGNRLYDFYKRMGYVAMETHFIKDVC